MTTTRVLGDNDPERRKSRYETVNIELGSYHTVLSFGNMSSTGKASFNARTTRDSVTCGTANGYLYEDKTAEFLSISKHEDLSLRQRVAGVYAVMLSCEGELRRRGVTEAIMYTHPTMAKLLGDIGWVDEGPRSKGTLVTKNLQGEGMFDLPKILEIEPSEGGAQDSDPP